MSWEILVDEVEERPADTEVDPATRLEDVLGQLPPTQREAFTLVKLEGLDVEQAARRAGTTVGALKVRAHRAYKAIKQIMGR
jgi:RNA polymerase sigma-70 factor (ECF subfamily)